MAVGNFSLSKVNISLAEFQKMSDGKYNAGEVRLSSETGVVFEVTTGRQG